MGVLAVLALVVSMFDWQGLVLTGYSNTAYGDEAAVREAADDMQEVGADTTMFVTNWQQDNLSSTEIRPAMWLTPHRTTLIKGINAAKENGLRVALKPIVDPIDAEGGWRADIDAEPTAWFRSYRTVLMWHVNIAVEADVDLLVLGTELRQMALHTEEWAKLADEVRERYDGTITYSANHDDYWLVDFWDSVDLIGVDPYFPLADHHVEDPDVLETLWVRHRDGLRDLSDAWNKPVLLAEVGYASQDKTVVEPWSIEITKIENQAAQAMAIEALFRTFEDQDWIAGMFLWSWKDVGGRDYEVKTNHTLEGKWAAEIVRGRWADPDRDG